MLAAAVRLPVRFGAHSDAMLDSLKANAFGMYLIHYVFVVWLQYALLPAELPALVKAASCSPARWR